MKKTNESGITLIALVVTIVVLLILAGVTIAYVLGDDSIFTTANKAATDTKDAVILEYVGNAQASVLLKYYNGDTLKTPVEELQANFPSATDYAVADTGTGETAAKIEKGKISGTFTVTTKTTVYTVKLTNGVAEVTNKADV